MSKPAARKPTLSVSGYETSWVRCAVAVLLVLAGIAWIVVYTQVAMDAANFVKTPGVKAPSDPLPWMSDLGKWNYLIGFGSIFLGLIVAAHPTTPLGRGRGVVVGMLGCFLIGLAWIITYYFVAQSATAHLPVMDQLDQSNLLVGVGFMAVGFVFATKWE
ncbi:cell division protein CrgA [Marmoricola sp. RAF53]|uniref:cell division protein CrgA n=1 Tax=Marmoricola sp. RAF53 TaxID=3233059 RepID=UPI003F9E6F46